MRLILTRNSFSFNGDIYLQQHGTAMGTRMAPSFANLFMGKLEQNLPSNQDRQPLVWWRYTDNIFTIWTHGEPALQEFLESLNEYHTTIKFTATWSTKEVTFLDIQVYVTEHGIHTDLHVKPTDTHQYLHINSCHPKHCKNAIPYSQALRLRRICSEQEDFLKRTNDLKKHLKRRGYSEQFLQPEIQRVIDTPREDSLQLRGREKSDQIPLVVTYNPTLLPLGDITRRCKEFPLNMKLQ